MKNFTLLAVCCLFLVGCACHGPMPFSPQSTSEAGTTDEPALFGEGPGASRIADAAMPQEAFFSRMVLMKTAWAAMGTPYMRGGTTPNGFDCSGLVQWTYRHVGINLPRTAREQSSVGELVRKEEEMRVGDIVAFRHPKRGYHTGIYIGDGKFIHSPRARSAVKVSSLDDAYFRNTFLGARRIDLSRDLQARLSHEMINVAPGIGKIEKTAKVSNGVKTKKQAVSRRSKASGTSRSGSRAKTKANIKKSAAPRGEVLSSRVVSLVQKKR